MLSHDALDIGYAVRELEGPDVKGVGPDITQLVELERVRGKTGPEIRAALIELEGYGYFRISRCIGQDRQGVPKELRDIAGVSILEPLQALFDEMGI